MKILNSTRTKMDAIKTILEKKPDSTNIDINKALMATKIGGIPLFKRPASPEILAKVRKSMKLAGGAHRHGPMYSDQNGTGPKLPVKLIPATAVAVHAGRVTELESGVSDIRALAMANGEATKSLDGRVKDLETLRKQVDSLSTRMDGAIGRLAGFEVTLKTREELGNKVLQLLVSVEADNGALKKQVSDLTEIVLRVEEYIDAHPGMKAGLEAIIKAKVNGSAAPGAP